VPKVTQAHVDARREAILAAAHRLFARRGFHNTTMGQVAAEAGLSTGAVYRYFSGKEVLIEALAAAGRQQRRELLEPIEPSAPVGGALVEVATRLLGAMEDPGMLQSLRLDVRLWAEALDSPVLKRTLRRALEETAQHIAAVASQGGVGDQVRGVDSGQAARACLALALGSELLRLFEPKMDMRAYTTAVRALLEV
jgi:AcrR family transcriptional regulator